MTDLLILNDASNTYNVDGLYIDNIKTNATTLTRIMQNSISYARNVNIKDVSGQGGFQSTKITMNEPVKIQVWIDYTDTYISLGDIPKNIVLNRVEIFVTEDFNAGTNNYISVGNSTSATAYTANQDVSSAGRYEPTYNQNIITTANNFRVTYTQSGSTATTGRALVVIEFTPIQASP